MVIRKFEGRKIVAEGWSNDFKNTFSGSHLKSFRTPGLIVLFMQFWKNSSSLLQSLN